ncbi:MBOAT family O-acyltransferase [Robertkochia solimangrovi]|uniref:MBOAT family O-acyltransferase n=1 Tax=Robertkochia solimangrovi TaxID=2213046 RepID=UPI0011816DED|nr:MBOAT family O-acyltransferase [Robertkochia solimangrovi]TRZ42531.1 MBOAT family protein [Robertkochia solimangrovi]
MLFNSIEFLIFLPVSFILYWLLFRKNLKIQNTLLVVLSYIFYGAWDYRFLALIFLSTLVDYLVGIQLGKPEQRHRRLWLWTSISFNIGLLGFFKYYNFFADSFYELLEHFGYHAQNQFTLNILLPVGISFYTFQTMSYSLDIYHKKLKPTKDFIAFSAYVSFFPQLVAGPIERASHLLPQMLNKRKFNYLQAVEGLRLILWGFFKKIAIADALAPIVDDIFSNSDSMSSSSLFIGAVFFGFQIYGDFSGYSDIAIGTSKLFGFELMSNFKFPYFSRNIVQFWRRWHISLSTWFRDYIYYPLGGSKGSKITTIRNVFVIFLVSGLWHGANWTFVFWGGLHALLFLPFFFIHKAKWNPGLRINRLTDIISVMLNFLLVTITWIFFRAENLTSAFEYLKRMFTDFSITPYLHPAGYRMIDYFILLLIFTGYEFLIRRNERAPYPFKNKWVRLSLYSITVLAIMLFYDDQVDRSFIYFQF